MTRVLFSVVFLLGAAVVVWMAAGFVGADWLALTVTFIIGAVYCIGFIEQAQFRKDTQGLQHALSNIKQPLETLDSWLNILPLNLQNAVRLRIEGERVLLPGPVLTPYLVGLLVMLGLLGTFVGMVVTLKGAVLALEGSTELQAIRAGLAAPIEGLGLAFGTSVAGVAASAMLGLVSTLNRRDRVEVTGKLDQCIAIEFRDFSLVHHRQETYRALQSQAEALPLVAERLQSMAGQIEKMGQQLGQQLLSNQEHFQGSVKSVYEGLANSVEQSLKNTLAESGRLAGENIEPIVQRAMASISTNAEKQLTALTGTFTQVSQDVAEAWRTGLSEHQEANNEMIVGLQGNFTGFNEQLKVNMAALLESMKATSNDWLRDQNAAEAERRDEFVSLLKNVHEDTHRSLVGVANGYLEELKDVAGQQKSTLSSTTNNLQLLSDSLSEHWQQAHESSITQQQRVCALLEETAATLSDKTSTTTAEMIAKSTELLSATENLVHKRMDAESDWLSQHQERMQQLTAVLQDELSALREDELKRGEAAVSRLEALEGTVSRHLTELGCALEAPMTQLIETASETPKAAAEVIEKLRKEISNNIERDNNLLEERTQLMAELNRLLVSVEETSAGQRQAIETLVGASTTSLQTISEHFSEQVKTEVDHLSGVSENFAGSAAEMSSLAESFGLAVQLFNESNQTLIENLNRIELAIESSSTRSDEQLAYYVNQAREIIDHSILSQKEVFDELQQLRVPQDSDGNEKAKQQETTEATE
ncbi:MAG: DUF802 domain-containing protein [Pseudomonadales bacterium]|nr:DUF802 domain-containing protein [Pseudomonadales bacterium]